MASTFGDISNFLSGGQLGTGLAAEQQAADILGQTNVTDLASLIPQLQLQVQQGKLTPAQAQAAVQQATALNNIATNPNLTTDQLAAINQLKQVASSGGLTPMDQAQLLDIQNQIANKNSAEQGAIQNQFAQQGQGGSGASQQARMLAAQGNANAGSLAGAQVAGNAQQRALTAMQNYGTMAQQAQNQSFQQQAQQAQAADAINRFNAANQQQVNTGNAANQQQANVGNFNTANTIAGTNVGIQNQQAMLPYQAAQQNFTNLLNRNSATSNALNKQGTALIDQGNKQASTTAGYIQAAAPYVANAISTYGPQLASTVSDWLSDEDQKTDISPADSTIEGMMDKLVGKRFKYKQESGEDPTTQHVGVMAQDAKAAGLNTRPSPEGLRIMDDPKMKGTILAALGNLHSRIASLEGK